MAVSDDGVLETEVVSTDPEPKGDGDAICVQFVQTMEKPNHWVKTLWVWVNLYMDINNVKLLYRELPGGVFWSISYPR